MPNQSIPAKSLILPEVNETMFDTEIAKYALTEIVLDQVSWKLYDYKPDVKAHLAYSHEAFYLYWQVREAYFRATVKEHNAMVYEDSCVEFFLSLDGVTYYNIEFNALGYGLIGYGDNDKSKRVNLPVETVGKIRASSNGIMSNGGEVAWDLLLRIPYEVFAYHDFVPHKGLRLAANFYKCGDKCGKPHFVAWNRIETAEPNFHVPTFFGNIVLG